MSKVAVIGTGPVADSLAKGFAQHGHEVQRAARSASKLPAGEKAVGMSDAASWAEIVVIAVKGSGAEATVDALGIENLAGKIIIDPTNPIADNSKPDNGVIRYFTNANESLMERLQAKAPKARFVKAFNSVGNMFMVNPPFKPTPTMFICGNDDGAKAEVAKILTQFGWEAADMGKVESARPIEMLCQLWCVRGLLSNDWPHAFKWLSLG